MRWPWQREQPAPAPQEQVAPEAPADRIPPVGWAFLPPLQRTIGNVQLTVDPDRFAGAISAWSDPSFTGRMAHLVSAQAPPGVIDVDGGGPVPADDGYPARAGEMTLLPPTPPVRPMRGGYGSSPAAATATATAQRVMPGGAEGASPEDGTGDTATDAYDGGAAGTGSRADGAEDGALLRAARGTTFPVLHIEPVPLQRSGSGSGLGAEAELTPPVRSLPDPGVTGPPAFLPDAGMTPPGPDAEDSSPSQYGGPERPGRYGSSSDGGATYVQIPPAIQIPPAVQIPRDTAVQRTSAGHAGRTPLPGNGQRPVKAGPGAPRLGLGMPLSFAEPAAEPAASAERPSGTLAGTFPLPVQRAQVPAVTAPPVPDRAADGGDGAVTERVIPDSEVDATRELSEGTEHSTSEQVTTRHESADGSTSGPPGPETSGEPGSPSVPVSPPQGPLSVIDFPTVQESSTQGPLPDQGLGTAAETAVSLPEVASAPLLSAAVPAGTIDLTSGRGPAEAGAAAPHMDTSPALPVVSRLSSDVQGTEAGDAGSSSDPEEARTGLPPDAAPAPAPEPEPSSDAGVHPDAPSAPPASTLSGITAAVSAEPGRMLLSEPAAAGTPGPEPATTPLQQDSPPLQRRISEDASATDVRPEQPVLGAQLPFRTHGPGGNRPSNGSLSIPTSAGPVVLRVIQGERHDPTPETWPKLTASPAVAPAAGRQPAPKAVSEVQRLLISGGVAGSGTSAGRAAIGPSPTDSPAPRPAMPWPTMPLSAGAAGTDTGTGAGALALTPALPLAPGRIPARAPQSTPQIPAPPTPCPPRTTRSRRRPQRPMR